jgi:tetratricopeptide (TPR) repeat protein
MRIHWKVASLLLAIWAAVPAHAQTPAQLVTQGDAAYGQRNAKDARGLFLQAIAMEPRNYEALWKASRAEVDLAEAAAAIVARPRDAEGHFSLARAIGRKALSVGTMDRIRFSKIVYAEALEALAYDSVHAGALHVLGMWNAEIMRVNGLARAFAKTFLGAQVFAKANWDEAQRLLEAAVKHDPRRMVHRLDLAGIYTDRGDKAKAKELYDWIGAAPVVEVNDDLYKRQAADRLRKL